MSTSTLSKTFFSYIPTDSFIARLHPLTKIGLFFVLSIIAFVFNTIIDLLALLILDIILIFLTKIPVFSKKFMKIVGGFVIANSSIFIAWCLFSQRPGSIIYFETTIVLIKDIWIWNILITDQTIYYASRISLRSLIMFFLALMFFIGTTDRDLIHGLRSIKVPFTLCLVINLIFRGIAMFENDYQIIREAMQTRGVDFKKVSIPQKIRNFGSIFIAMIVLLFKRTEEMANSIESRGIPFRSKNRTVYHYFPLKKKDIVILISIILFFGFSIYLRFINQGLVNFLIGYIPMILKFLPIIIIW
ncbi:MAG: energy-coupling factor transporter transmembrane protein EcfT [Promethearchaeota archaeon]|nr:MAG: energy-coupling factor transporter transmembrane protein EcfT [Candidatus Lokiarchaeota archaeon]